MQYSMFIQIIPRRNDIKFFLAEHAGRFVKQSRRPVTSFSAQAKLFLLGIGLAIGLYGCGPSKGALMKQFDAAIGGHKDRLITELGLPSRDCTPLQHGEACEWRQKGRPPFHEGPLEGTFPGDTLTYFFDSKQIVCQWRFQGNHSGAQHSASRC